MKLVSEVILLDSSVQHAGRTSQRRGQVSLMSMGMSLVTAELSIQLVRSEISGQVDGGTSKTGCKTSISRSLTGVALHLMGELVSYNLVLQVVNGRRNTRRNARLWTIMRR